MKTIINIELDGVYPEQYPEFEDAFISAVQFEDGTYANDSEINEIESKINLCDEAYLKLVNQWT